MNATLKYILNGQWMLNPTYHVQAAHAFAAAFFVTLFSFMLGIHGLIGILAAGVPLIAAKEFAYDIFVEKDTWAGSGLDFGCYMIGATVATILALVKLLAL